MVDLNENNEGVVEQPDEGRIDEGAEEDDITLFWDFISSIFGTYRTIFGLVGVDVVKIPGNGKKIYIRGQTFGIYECVHAKGNYAHAH